MSNGVLPVGRRPADLLVSPASPLLPSPTIILQKSINIFRQQLVQVWARKKTPQRLKRRILETRASDPFSTPRIFLDNGGFKAWFAYFLATEGKTHFRGRHERSTILSSFKSLELSDQVDAAKRVASIKPHHTISSALDRICKVLADDGIVGIEIPPQAHLRKPPANPGWPAVTTILSPNDQRPQRGPGNPSPTPISSQHIVLENASLQGIADVFGPYMCSAIRRDTVNDGSLSLKAAVTMDFPVEGLVDCLMSLAIHQNKVEYLASTLFNVHVESERQVRYVLLGDGAKLIPNPEMTLKGAREDAIVNVLGPEIHEAIKTSQLRTKEVEEGNRMTECVSMILTGRSDEGAIVNLALGLKGGVQIQKKLYS